VRLVAEEIGRDALDAFERVGDRARLLEDLLLHVVAIGSELRGAGPGGDALDLAVDAREAVGPVDPVLDPVAPELQVGDVAFLEVHDALGHAGERHRIRREERLAVADAEHQRRAEPRADDAVRLVAAEDGDRVGAVQLDDGALDRVEQVAFVVEVDEVRDHLGVGLAREHVAARLKRRTERLVVLDDAVVHDGDAPRARHGRVLARAVREMRMRVVHGRRAVRRPARMRDPGRPDHAVAPDQRVELGDALGAARALEAAVLPDGHAAAVVAAVLEALQALDQDRDDVPGADRCNDSAHGFERYPHRCEIVTQC
jgi:hypothetical protein